MTNDLVSPATRRAAAVVLVAFAHAAFAAEATFVQSSFDPGESFRMTMDAAFSHSTEWGRIVREWYADGAVSRLREFDTQKTDLRLDLDAHIGLFRDLELHLGLPIVFQSDRQWTFAPGTGPSTTTVTRSCGNARGEMCDAPGSGSNALFSVDPLLGAYRSGLGDFRVGLGFAPLVQTKQPEGPTWSLRLDYIAPTAQKLDPTVSTGERFRGNIGERLHRLQFATALSRAIGPVEPYLSLQYTLPWQATDVYSNCDHPSDESLGKAENCDRGVWSRAKTGLQPQHTVAATFGAEVTLMKRTKAERVSVDFLGVLNYISSGRVVNELSEQLGKLLHTSDYGQVGAELRLTGRPAAFLEFTASALGMYKTDHFLTGEPLASRSATAFDLEMTPEIVNPNFDHRIDRTGRRFRIQNQWLLKVMVMARFHF